MSSAPCLEVTKIKTKIIILKFQTSPKFAHINMRLCRKKVTLFFFYIQYRSWEIVSQIWWCAHQIGHETISLQCFHISSKIWYSVITSMTWGYMYSFWKVPPTGQEMWPNSAHSILHHFAKIPSIMLQPIQLCWWAWLDYIIAPCMFPKITITGSTAI